MGPYTPARLARVILPLATGDSLHKALHRMRAYNIAQVPVVENGKLIGMLSEAALAGHLGDDPAVLDDIRVLDAMQPLEVAIPTQATLAQAEEVLQSTGGSWLPVISQNGYYLGCLYLVDLLAARSGRLYPPRMGGMATPLGVYLTTGKVSGGADWRGLMLTGVLMALMFTLVQFVLAVGVGAGAHFTHSLFIRNLAHMLWYGSVNLPENSPPLLTLLIIAPVLQIAVFLLALRFGPWLAGYHAAEHQTVNAVEAGESLTVENVRNMPRVHPRCGTNLWAVIIMVSFGYSALVLLWNIGQGQIYQLAVSVLGLTWAAFTFNRWQSFGGWLQQHFTTRPATQRQLESGILAARQVIERHQQCDSPVATLPQRLWNMGLAPVAAGMIGAIMAIQWLSDAWVGVSLDRIWLSLVK